MKLNNVVYLSYDEIAKMKNDPDFVESICKQMNARLLMLLQESLTNETNLDVAFRMQVQLQDEMNLVGKIEDIPINVVSLNVVGHLQSDFINKKLSFKNRLKILFKGGL